MDDLMRMQEARPHKRMRLEEGDVKGAASGSGSGSDSGSGTGSDNEEEEEEEDGSEEEYERDDSPVLPPKDFGTVSRVSALAQKDMPSTNPTPAVSDITWGDMNITASLQMALSSMSIRAPTEIQQACIPPLLSGEFFIPTIIPNADIVTTQGRDCIGNAKTGSGKTIAFALPILQKLSADPYGIFALVLTPTRCADLSALRHNQLIMDLITENSRSKSQISSRCSAEPSACGRPSSSVAWTSSHKHSSSAAGRMLSSRRLAGSSICSRAAAASGISHASSSWCESIPGHDRQGASLSSVIGPG
jgi:hypothetical protein